MNWDIESVKDDINRCLRHSQYFEAELILLQRLEVLGPKAAPALYPLVWEHAMASGRGRLRSYFLREQSFWDEGNVLGDAVRQQQLVLAGQAPPQIDRPVSRYALSQLSCLPGLQGSWSVWEECIGIVQEFLTEGWRSAGDADLAFSGDIEKPMVLTAGSGRSGSSAVFDWLNGFEEFIGTRDQHFYLRDFSSIIASSGSPEDYRRGVVELFWRTFFGRFLYNSKSSYRRFALARRMISSVGADMVAGVSRDVLAALTASADGDGQGSPVELGSLLAIVARLFCPADKRFIATGWLDFDKSDEYSRIPTAHVVCSIRDPRDVFAEHLRLTRTFNPNVGRFITEYRDKLQKLHASLEGNKLGNVHVVRFEEFVCSESVRTELCRSLEITPSRLKQDDRQFEFSAESSSKNVGVHSGCENKSAMARIESELAEYCFYR